MPESSSSDLHGNAPDKSSVALLLIDVINSLEFDGSEALLEHALPMARKISALKKRADKAGVPAVYVNDNFGQWRSNFAATVEHCLNDGVPGEPIARLLKPGEEDYFVLKPKHSGFYTTSLDLLLQHIGAKTLILTGMAADICVLFTAGDAYVRGYKLFIPRDCVASNSVEENDAALKIMSKVVKAETRPSDEIDFTELAAADES